MLRHDYDLMTEQKRRRKKKKEEEEKKTFLFIVGNTKESLEGSPDPTQVSVSCNLSNNSVLTVVFDQIRQTHLNRSGKPT